MKRYNQQVGQVYMRGRRSETGFVSVLILFVAALIAVFSLGLINIGDVSIKINTEKQLLDSHGVMVGQSIIQNGIDETCGNGLFIGEMADRSEEVFDHLNQVEADDRSITCNQVQEELIERGEDDPDGPPGTYRRYRVRSTLNSDIFGEEDEDAEDHSREVIVEVREIHGEVEKARPQIMFVLDYSGSMSSNGRYNQLVNAVTVFVNQNNEVDYGVILFDDEIIRTLPINSGAPHAQDVLSMINSYGPGGGTKFANPLSQAISALNTRDSQELFIVLISDGYPSDAGSAVNVINNAIRSIDPQICTTRQGNDQCITVYTLGVDNADIDLLESLSGNAATAPNDRDEFTFVANAAGTQAAFASIVEDILCRFGPIDPVPSPQEYSTINVFLNERSLELDSDFVYEPDTNSIKLFDEAPNFACTGVIDQGGEVTIRYGQPRLIIEDEL